jgi:hypothetical protein
MRSMLHPRLMRLVLSALTAAVAAAPLASQTSGVGGDWVSAPRQLTVLRSLVGENSRGWNGHLEGVAEVQRYLISIQEDETGVSISFPGGPSNFLTTPRFSLDGLVHAQVVSRGDWWEKFLISGSRAGQTLRLAATRLNGWWSIDPDTVRAQHTQLVTAFVATLDAGGDTLSLRVTVADEKGEAEYMQIFSRLR